MIEVTIPQDRLAAITESEQEAETDDQALNVQGADTQEGEGESAAGQTEDKDESKDPVPYSRFSEVIAAKNAAKAEADALKAELAELRAGRTQGSEVEYEELDQSVEARIQRIELAAATKTLDAEVSAARSKFPEVPEAVLYKAVAEDPSIDVATVAESYHNYVAGVKQKAVEEYLATNPGPAKVPPAIKTTSSAGQVKARPKSLEEAHAAMRASLRTVEW